MAYSAKILADSLSPLGDRLTSFEITFPRIVLAEFNTHRMFSRNSASSRAIPVRKILSRVVDDPFIPVHWGKNQSGMRAEAELNLNQQAEAREIWLEAMADNVYRVIELQLSRYGWDNADRLVCEAIEFLHQVTGKNWDNSLSWECFLPKQKLAVLETMVDLFEPPFIVDEEALNVHKQIANRLLEPWMWHTVIVTSTEWSNFFALRTEGSAQPEIQTIANMMHELYHEHEPIELDYSQWHTPLVDPGELAGTDFSLQAVCTGRCCRVSYLTHDGKRDPASDVILHNSLLENGHMSPFEHPARPMTPIEKKANPWSGNFYGWVQYRKTIENESDFSKVRRDHEGVWCEDCLAVHAHRVA